MTYQIKESHNRESGGKGSGIIIVRLGDLGNPYSCIFLVSLSPLDQKIVSLHSISECSILRIKFFLLPVHHAMYFFLF